MPRQSLPKEESTQPPTDFSAELLDVQDKLIPASQLYLDPNNPRIVTEGARTISDKDIPRRQEHMLELIRERIGIEDVKDKIASVGYQRHERIFVRPLRGTTKGYVVLEGNRRVASVKTLQQQIDEDELQISNAAKKSLREIPAVVYHGNNPDIAWLVQGLRHFSASPIKRWEPIQQARFIEKTAEQSGAEEIKIGKQFGVKPRETAKLIDALHLFRQAKAHRDYGDSIDDSKFTMFHDGIFDKREALATEFLGYNEDAKKATNEANFSRFLALITSSGSKGTSTIRRAIDVRDKLPKIILEKDVLDRLVDGEIDLDEAYQEIISRTKSRESGKFSPEEELKSLQASLDRITKLPSTAISMNGDVKGQFVDLLRKIQRIVKAHLEMLD